MVLGERLGDLGPVPPLPEQAVAEDDARTRGRRGRGVQAHRPSLPAPLRNTNGPRPQVPVVARCPGLSPRSRRRRDHVDLRRGVAALDLEHLHHDAVGHTGVTRVAGAEHGEPEVAPVERGRRAAVRVDDPGGVGRVARDGITAEASTSRENRLPSRNSMPGYQVFASVNVLTADCGPKSVQNSPTAVGLRLALLERLGRRPGRTPRSTTADATAGSSASSGPAPRWHPVRRSGSKWQSTISRPPLAP